MDEIEIRPISTTADLKQAETLQQVVWGGDDLEVISYHTLHALQHNGSCLIGAFVQDKLVGFVMGVLGLVNTPDRIDQVAAARLKMYSVMAGVLPEYQKSGIGYRLKLAQREFANHIGIRLITWTYDPLESLNAHLNISKLGCICQTYHRNFHGEMGGINAGLPTDRFDIEWWVTSNRVESRVGKRRRPLSYQQLLDGNAQLINPTTFDKHGLPLPAFHYDLDYHRNLLLLEIPANFQAIKQNDPDLARGWREHTRYLFEDLFAHQFIITDFALHEENGRKRSFYLLTNRDA